MFYKIVGVGPGLDGLIVETGLTKNEQMVVTKIINPNQMFGDRNIAFPVHPGALIIGGQFLEPVKEELKEYDSRNPFGKYMGETRIRRYDLEAVIVEHEYCLQVTILEHEEEDAKYNQRGRKLVHTRYTQNFFKDFAQVMSAVAVEVKTGNLEELIFTLKELKEQELSTDV